MRRLQKKMGWLAGLLLLLVACGDEGETAVATPPRNNHPTAASTSAVSVAETLEPRSPTPEPLVGEKYADYEMVTLLPRDAIPAIDDPKFLTAAEAEEFYAPDELVMGVSFNGEARAYSVPFLSRHEIVNDTVGGVKIAVTW